MCDRSHITMEATHLVVDPVIPSRSRSTLDNRNGMRKAYRDVVKQGRAMLNDPETSVFEKQIIGNFVARFEKKIGE